MKRTYVLVHGAWVGEWTWGPVAKILRHRGHEVYNVSLRGQGERSDELSSDITFEDHVNDVLSVLEKNDLRQVYLVPHSYGGKVATGAWDRARDRIHHVIYIDAFAPIKDKHGKQAYILTEGYEAQFRKTNPEATDRTLVPYPLQNQIEGKITDMPLGTIGAKLDISEPFPERTHKSYILAGNETQTPFYRDIYPNIKDDDSWTKYVLPTGHFVMLDMPEVLAAILLYAK